MFSDKFDETLEKAQIGYTSERFAKITILFSFVVSLIFAGFALFLWTVRQFPVYFIALVFAISFFSCFFLITLIPVFALKKRKNILESDLLYSTRHLLIKLESGSSLLNSLESVSKLSTNSSLYFRELVYDVSLGMPIEEAISKAIQYSPSKAYTKILEEIEGSLKTGTDLQKALKSTLEDITKQHLIQIEEYGRKLNPMSMFYMIIGTIVPSLGTAMLVVATSLLPGAIIVDKRILLSIAFLLAVIQIFFVLAFRSLKPAVIE